MPKKPDDLQLFGRGFLQFVDMLGKGIIRFFEMLFDFILKLFKVLPEFLKAIAWILGACAILILAALAALHVAFSTMGFKDSPVFQEYRDIIILDVIEKDPRYMEIDEKVGGETPEDETPVDFEG